MVVKLSSLKVDLEREVNGDWIDFPDWPGVRFNCSSLHLPAYVTARDQMLKRLQKQYRKSDVPSDVVMAEIGKLYAEHILHGWDGLDIAYSKDAARETLGNPEYRNVIAAVEWCAGKVSQIDVEFVEDEVKNSAAPSATASGTSARRRAK